MRARRALVAVAALVTTGAVLAGCGGDEGPGTVGLFDRAPVPAVPDRTMTIDASSGVDATVGVDGQYWGQLVDVFAAEPPHLTFRLTQALFAEACIAELGAEACADGHGVVAEPSRVVDVPLSGIRSVTVVSERQQNYAITADELLSLAGDGTAAATAPADYTFADFPFLLTVRNGTVIDVRQIWVP